MMFIGIKPKKIVLIGDSAGGNLIAGITIKSIKSGFRIPDGLFMVYPGWQRKKKKLYNKVALLS